MTASDVGLYDSVRQVGVATIGHYIEVGAVDPEIQSVVPDVKIAGPAVTVRIVPPDSVPVYVAIDRLQPGDVLVVDTGGERTHAAVGEVVALAAAERGAAAIVIDGVCTDVREIREIGLPVFARGRSALTTKLLGNLGGSINEPVSCGAVPVHAGDVVVGDDNGLLVLSPADLPRLIKLASADEREEVDFKADLRKGVSLSALFGTDSLFASERS